MLLSLDIRDMLIIDTLSLEFKPGLNVLTGETGAGKSILLDALGFVLGWRGRAELVRQGANQGEVTACFALHDAHAVHEILRDAGLPDDDQVILRRINSKDGRKTAWVNDRRCSGDVLRHISAQLLELHGQHDDRGLINPKGHRTLLDYFGGLHEQVKVTASSWSQASQIRRRLEKAHEAMATLRAEEEFLRHAVDELDQLAPLPGEEAELDQKRRLMQNGARQREDIARANSLLSVEGAEGLMGDAQRWLEPAAAKLDGALDTALEALNRAQSELADAQDQLLDCLQHLTFDPHELETCEERLFAIRALARKHNVVPDNLAELANDLRHKLSDLDQSDEKLHILEGKSQEARAAYDAAAAQLSQDRHTAAKALDCAVMEELAPLKMERAVFTTQVRASEPGLHGVNHVEFEIATNPGAPSGSLAKIASGGELSRFLLALKVSLNDAEARRVLIFDEIDRGVGGATADAVGRRLAKLSEHGQVLVVTHSPQVAARAAHHLHVKKHQDAEMTRTHVYPLDTGARVDEIARMISGDRITDAARAAAQELIQTKN